MAVYYKVYQSCRKNNPNKGKWYARAAMVGTDSTDELAEAIEEKCTVHKADVVYLHGKDSFRGDTLISARTVPDRTENRFQLHFGKKIAIETYRNIRRCLYDCTA